jgi:hypothetical protein
VGLLRRIVRRFRRRSRCHDYAPEEPPFDEPALVALRPRPTPGAGSVALELPDEPDDVDARGRDVA